MYSIRGCFMLNGHSKYSTLLNGHSKYSTLLNGHSKYSYLLIKERWILIADFQLDAFFSYSSNIMEAPSIAQ